MSTTTSIGVLGPLTTTYTPQGSNCNSIYQTNPGRILLYGTTDGSVASCFPTSFNPNDNFYYSPGICPSGYDYACTAGLGGGATAATCCPTGYVCRKGRVATDTNACQSTLVADSSFTILALTLTTTPAALVTNFYQAGNTVYAKGVVIRRDSDDPVWIASTSTTSATTSTTSIAALTATSTTASSTIPTQTSSNSVSSQDATGTNGEIDAASGLSTGAKVGVGIGVAFGVLLIIGAIVAAFVIGRRKRREEEATRAAQALPTPQAPPAPQAPHAPQRPQSSQTDNTWAYTPQTYTESYRNYPGESPMVENKEAYSNAWPVELEEQRRRWELEAKQPAELMGD